MLSQSAEEVQLAPASFVSKTQTARINAPLMLGLPPVSRHAACEASISWIDGPDGVWAVTTEAGVTVAFAASSPCGAASLHPLTNRVTMMSLNRARRTFLQSQFFAHLSWPDHFGAQIFNDGHTALNQLGVCCQNAFI